VLAIVGGALAYRSLQVPPPAPPEPAPPAVSQEESAEPPRVIQPPPETAPAPKPEPQAAAPAPAEAPKPEPAKPEPAKPEPAERPAPVSDAAAIRNLLERWSAAVRSGDVETVSRCYAPRLTAYLGRPGATQDDVRGHMKYLQGRDGKLAIHRIGEVGIAPEGDDLATVRFRRHWETASHPRTSGESKQQMTLVRTSGGWKIAAEQETRVY
jgi:ketosteroid isomerase-like protein